MFFFEFLTEWGDKMIFRFGKRLTAAGAALVIGSAMTLSQTDEAQAGGGGTALGIGAAVLGGALLLSAISKNGRRSNRRRGTKRYYRRSAASAQVKRVQESLNTLGFHVGRPDGRSGRNTRAGINQFQASIRQPMTGRLTEMEKGILFNQAMARLTGRPLAQTAPALTGPQGPMPALAGAPAMLPGMVQTTRPIVINAPVAVVNTSKYPPINPASYPKAKTRNEDAVAVLIGNSDYKNGIPTVTFGSRDADAMKAILVNTMGFSSENIIDLRNATLADITEVFGKKGRYKGKLWQYIDPEGGSDIVVFFSGHGVPDTATRDAYILPSDGDPNQPDTMGYPLSLMYENLGKLKAKSVSVFIDACFSGATGDGGSLIKSASPVFIAAKTDTANAELSVFTAARGNQYASWDEKIGHGMFTRYLVEGLKGQADTNGDKSITNGELSTYLRKNVRKAARRTYRREQEITFSGKTETVLVSF